MIKELQLINEKGYYSQTSEDRCLDYIFKEIGFKTNFIVELGAGDGVNLSNCKYLIDTYKLNALRLEGNEKHKSKDIQTDWITKDNIVDLLKDCPNGFDLLSIDLDGNDYWILQEILNNYIPRVIILEVNGTLNPNEITIMPYNEKHEWNNDNYYGASFLAFKLMLQKYGYKLIRNINDLNLIFIKELKVSDLNWLRNNEIKGQQVIYHPVKQNAKWLRYPLISVVMPSYLTEYPGSATDRENKFKRAINSVLEQSYLFWELIIISDGCDKTVQLYLKNYANFDNIKCFKVKKQSLFSGVLRNIGISKASGEYITYLDSDDYLGKEHLKNIAAQLENDWVLFDNIYKYNDFEKVSITKIDAGSSTTSTICHKRQLPVKWNDGYLHDWNFIQQLLKFKYKKIDNNQYFVCHTRNLKEHDC